MEIIVKLVDKLFSINWVSLLVTFVITIIIANTLSNDTFYNLPFEKDISVIISLATIGITVYLILHFILTFYNTTKNKYNIRHEYYKTKEKQKWENYEKWRCFFDSISSEEYSIIMFFVKTENKRPYKSWRKMDHYNSTNSIFYYKKEEEIFYKTVSYDEKVKFKEHENSVKSTIIKGDACVYTMKSEFYNMLKEIMKEKGSLSHHSRKLYRLEYGNGSDLPEFQKTRRDYDYIEEGD